MGAQLPEIGSFKDFDADNQELKDLESFKSFRDKAALEAGDEGLKFGRESGYQGYSPSLCPGDPTKCECTAYRSIQILNQQFKDSGIQFYRACAQEGGNLETEVYTDSLYGYDIGRRRFVYLNKEKTDVFKLVDRKM